MEWQCTVMALLEEGLLGSGSIKSCKQNDCILIVAVKETLVLVINTSRVKPYSVTE